MKPLDLTGQKFGRWTVLFLGNHRGHLRYWRCRCECGTEKEIYAGSLKDGRSLSCGCLSIEKLKVIKATHGHTRGYKTTPEYRAWRHMNTRCYNPNCPMFYRYGGRGIQVCDRWRDSFEVFLADVGPRPSPNHSINRIDNDGNYEKGNVCWTTNQEQCRNRSSNHFITANGVSRSLTEWSELTGIGGPTIRKRLKLGWPPERAVSEPVRR